MTWFHWPRAAFSVLCMLGLLAEGCTSLREIPRSEYAASPERKDVRLLTRDGLRYEFDYVSVGGDSLVGYRHRDVEGPAEEYATVRVPLDDVAQLASRRLDWYRTGLIGGGVIAALVARGLTGSNNNGEGPIPGGGGKGGGIP